MDDVPGHDKPVDVAVQNEGLALSQPAVPDLVPFHDDVRHGRGCAAVEGDAVGVAVGVFNAVDEIAAELDKARASFHADPHGSVAAQEVPHGHPDDSNVISAADGDALPGSPCSVQNGPGLASQGDESGGRATAAERDRFVVDPGPHGDSVTRLGSTDPRRDGGEVPAGRRHDDGAGGGNSRQRQCNEEGRERVPPEGIRHGDDGSHGRLMLSSGVGHVLFAPKRMSPFAPAVAIPRPFRDLAQVAGPL